MRDEVDMDINKERLWMHLQMLGDIGRQQDGSITRLPFTKADKEGETLLLKWMQEAGLTTHMDAVGNILGTLSGRELEKAPILCGSHYDSVKNGGMFDGCLGVLAGIEALQTMVEKGIRPRRTIIVVACKDEEGNRFGYGMIGSKAIANTVQPEGFCSKDAQGVTLYAAMKQSGYHPDAYATCRIAPIHAYYELHIEQGRILDDQGVSIGIVKGISGLARYTITIFGESNHAGATAMKHRHDPVVKMCKWITKITELAEEAEDTVVTIGKIHTHPGVCNVICDHVRFSLDLRSLKEERIDFILQEMKIYEASKELQGVRIESNLEQRIGACPCDQQQAKVLQAICAKEHIKQISLVSGAGHDAMNFKDVCPISMLFVRSIKGYSHRKEEYSTKEDCAKGAQVLYKALCQ